MVFEIYHGSWYFGRPIAPCPSVNTRVHWRVVQLIGDWRDARRFPQRGRSVQAGPVRLNIDLHRRWEPHRDSGKRGGVPALGWIDVQRQVAKFARVCSYDRAGYRWSDPGPEPRSALEMAKELRLLLNNAGEKGPYVMVGASLGGLYVRVYRFRPFHEKPVGVRGKNSRDRIPHECSISTNGRRHQGRATT